MKRINQYIIERLRLSKNDKDKVYNELTQDQKDKISYKLCLCFQGIGTYQDKEDIFLNILEKHFNNDILEFFEYYDSVYENIIKDLNINRDELNEYIIRYNDELYKDIKEFVLL